MRKEVLCMTVKYTEEVQSYGVGRRESEEGRNYVGKSAINFSEN
jgi:hypothetical protein